MSETIERIAAGVEGAGERTGSETCVGSGRFSYQTVGDLPAHSFPSRKEFNTENTLRLRSGQVEEDSGSQSPHFWQQPPEVRHPGLERDIKSQNPHSVCAESAQTTVGHPSSVDDPTQNAWPLESEPHDGAASIYEELWEEERERRIYRRRTIRMLRRYMRYSIETGRLPSVLGREFFRAPVTPYSFVTFEDRVIFVHDMETSLNKLDEFSREIIARHILQEHDQEATARLLHCGARTIQRYVPIAVDLLSEILLDVGLLERTFPIREVSCQGGKTGEIFVSDSLEGKNKF